MNIVELAHPDDGARDKIVRHLRASNRQRMPKMVEQSHAHAIFVTDEAGEVTGGLWADRTFDWVFVELLFVPEALRGQGVGGKLLSMIEARAREWGARGVWLDTFGFQARGFYEKQGYTCFGTLEGSDPLTDKHLMRKDLA